MPGAPPFFVLLSALAVSLGIFVPLTGVLVRFRANYNPKGLQLDSEGGATPHTGPVIKSYFAMFSRVRRLEGWSGLYKGLMPTAISTLFVSIIILLFVDTNQPRHGRYRAPEVGIIGTLLYSVGMLVISLPTAIITYRAITTPHKLPYFNLSAALQVLLTPTERKRPWILYMTPGLLAAELLHICLVVLFLGPIRRLLVPELSDPTSSPKSVSAFKLFVYMIFVCLTVVALAPLEVIATRLAIQRNHSSTGQDVEDNSIEEQFEYSSPDEDVIGLRHEGDPYIGLTDCAKRIIDEEGLTTLYRAWWITLLGGLGSTFA
ncbi:hypothetical protein CVT24_009424 [Panaeolus cyanescens]|uniref:Mitochondrial carrier n=1 Tax=Panaeolus cyanescens TaxID=181874 RepID=A0A409VDJ6_9AGAR|nr:hypothetical protein CVT24_009424 [Panaeolus cyanescens]